MNVPKKYFPFIILAAVIGLLFAGYFFYQYQKTQAAYQALKSNPSLAAQDEAKKLVEQVGKLVTLPTDETPTIATVSDIDKLKDQGFFQKAKNGDKVLIYYQAKKAYLYDPVANKLIDVAPVNITANPTASASATVSNPSPEATSSAKIKIILRNGTKTVGLTTKYEPDVKKALPDATIADKENAVKNDYDRTLVVALNDNFKTQAQDLAKALKATVEDMPAGETIPKDVDLVVIFGKDKK